MPEDLQRGAPIAMDLRDMEKTLESSVPVTLTISTPPDARVRRNSMTGQLEIDDVTILDLVELRDSIDQQILDLYERAREQAVKIEHSWEPL